MKVFYESKPMNRLLPVAGLLAMSSAQAAITVAGDVSPDPSAWGGPENIYIGNTADGALTVDSGNVLNSGGPRMDIAYGTGVTGTVNVTGSGSLLNSVGTTVYTGSGTGIVNVTDGGSFNTNYLYIGGNGGTGIINVSGSGSALNIGNAIRVSDNGSIGVISVTQGGTFNISNSSPGFWVGDGSTAAISIDGPGSTWNTTGNLSLILGSTASASGTFAITHGGSANVSGGFNFETGTTTIDGAGSNLNAGKYFRVWTGKLNILDGATVTAGTAGTGVNEDSVIGFLRNAGKVTVDGAGSQWTNGSTLYVGNAGGNLAGYLSVSDGGTVAANAVSVNALSILSTDLGFGSALAVGDGSGTLTNNGTIRLAAGAGADSGSYTPLEYGALAGTGTVEALGGKWDAAAHTVTVSEATTAEAGEVATLDLSTSQRLLVTDPTTGHSVGLGFKGTDTPTTLSFSATEANGSEQASLQSLLEPGQSVLSAWDFTPGTGYASGDPVYLSLGIGSGLKLIDLAIWHFDGLAWSPFAVGDLAYDNLYASFTATGFSSYAVTAPVPVPAAVWLFGGALAGFGVFGRRQGGLAA